MKAEVIEKRIQQFAIGVFAIELIVLLFSGETFLKGLLSVLTIGSIQLGFAIGFAYLLKGRFKAKFSLKTIAAIVLFVAGIPIMGQSLASFLTDDATVEALSTPPILDLKSSVDSLPPKDVPINDTAQYSPFEAKITAALQDASVPTYFKEVYKAGKLLPCRDDNEILAICDSLSSSNSEHAYFYFMLFTKSLKSADGFYAEAVCGYSYSFLLEHTEAFADYFNRSDQLTEENLAEWAICAYGEIAISEEQRERALSHYKAMLNNQVQQYRKEYWPIMDRFVAYLQFSHTQLQNSAPVTVEEVMISVKLNKKAVE